jgi:hypothetical protein
VDNQPISNRWDELGNVKRQGSACATVIEEWFPFLPEDLPDAVLEYGLFLWPADMITTLQAKEEPGPYNLTKGWISVGDDLFEEHHMMVEKLGKAETFRINQSLIQKFKRLECIHSGQSIRLS